MSASQQSVGSASTTGAKKGFRAAWLGIIPVILIIAILAVVGYYVLSNFFGANGTWYGPMHVKSGIGTVSIETYLDLSTSFLGPISGSGSFCVPLPFNNTPTYDFSVQGSHDFVRPWQADPQPIHLSADYAITLPLGFAFPLGPQLNLRGNVANNTLTLTGGNGNATTTLAMKHGSKADFTAACKSLSPLGLAPAGAAV